MATEKETQAAKTKTDEGSAQYPFYTVEQCLPRLREIVAQHGIGGAAVPRKEICILLGKAEPTLMNFFSSCFQYGLMSNVASKGVSVNELFQKIETPAYGDQGKKAAIIEALYNPPLYKKLIDGYNGKIIPNETGLGNLFATKEYGVNSNTSAKAAKVFFENAKQVEIVDSSYRLRYIMPVLDGSTPPATQENKKDQQAPPDVNASKMFEQPIDLGSSTAFLKYPRNITAPEIAILKIMLNATLAAMEARQKAGAQQQPLLNNVTKTEETEL